MADSEHRRPKESRHVDGNEVMRFLYSGFPREMGTPRRSVVNDPKEFLDFVRVNNGRTNVYTSLYSFRETNGRICDYKTAKIDKVVHDFDALSQLDEAQKSREWVRGEGGWSLLVLSGGGWHVYIKVTCKRYDRPSDALYNFQEEMRTKLNLGFDKSLRGDVGRLIRVIGTMNMKTKTFCVPITQDMADTLTIEQITTQAKDPKVARDLCVVRDWKRYGELPSIDLSPWDHERIHEGPKIPHVDFEVNGILVVPTLDDIPPTLRRLCVADMGHMDRAKVISHVYGAGYTREECAAFLERFLSKRKYDHCIHHENQVNRI